MGVTEKDVQTLLKEVHKICQKLAKKRVESIFLWFNQTDHTTDVTCSPIGQTFTQNLNLIHQFQQYCKDSSSGSQILKEYNACDTRQEYQYSEGGSDYNEESIEVDSEVKFEDHELETKGKSYRTPKSKNKDQLKDEVNSLEYTPGTSTGPKVKYPISKRITRSASKSLPCKSPSRSSLHKSSSRLPQSKSPSGFSAGESRSRLSPCKSPSRSDHSVNAKSVKLRNKSTFRNNKIDVANVKRKKIELNRKGKKGVVHVKSEVIGESDTNQLNSGRLKHAENDGLASEQVNIIFSTDVTEKNLTNHAQSNTELANCEQDNKILSPMQGNKFQCHICKKEFSNMRSLGQHRIMKKHFLTCEICDQTFSRIKLYRIHVRLHKMEKVKQEKKEANEKLEKSFTCDICREGFTTAKGLGQHRYRYEHYHKCQHCGKMFTRKKAFGIHSRKHENNPRKRKWKKLSVPIHQCSLCGKIFSRSYPLAIHMRYHTGDKPYMCDTCGKVTASKTELNMHQRIHSEDRPYECEICHKTFKMLHKLKRHQNVHSGLKPHKCPECEKSFTTSTNMRVHIRNIHLGIKEFSCVFCGVKFAHSSNLKAHRKNIHKEKDVTFEDMNIDTHVEDADKKLSGSGAGVSITETVVSVPGTVISVAGSGLSVPGTEVSPAGTGELVMASKEEHNVNRNVGNRSKGKRNTKVNKQTKNERNIFKDFIGKNCNTTAQDVDSHMEDNRMDSIQGEHNIMDNMQEKDNRIDNMQGNSKDNIMVNMQGEDTRKDHIYKDNKVDNLQEEDNRIDNMQREDNKMAIMQEVVIVQNQMTDENELHQRGDIFNKLHHNQGHSSNVQVNEVIGDISHIPDTVYIQDNTELQNQGETIHRLQQADGTIIELNQGSEIHVVYNHDSGEVIDNLSGVKDNVPHLIYLCSSE